jgi:hypothetical protein
LIIAEPRSLSSTTDTAQSIFTKYILQRPAYFSFALIAEAGDTQTRQTNGITGAEQFQLGIAAWPIGIRMGPFNPREIVDVPWLSAFAVPPKTR